MIDAGPTVRIARPSTELAAAELFRGRGLGLDVLVGTQRLGDTVPHRHDLGGFGT